jgi:hypothetical protein
MPILKEFITMSLKKRRSNACVSFSKNIRNNLLCTCIPLSSRTNIRMLLVVEEGATEDEHRGRRKMKEVGGRDNRPTWLSLMSNHKNSHP